jgi:hypothetical protein
MEGKLRKNGHFFDAEGLKNCRCVDFEALYFQKLLDSLEKAFE